MTIKVVAESMPHPDLLRFCFVPKILSSEINVKSPILTNSNSL